MTSTAKKRQQKEERVYNTAYKKSLQQIENDSFPTRSGRLRDRQNGNATESDF